MNNKKKIIVFSIFIIILFLLFIFIIRGFFISNEILDVLLINNKNENNISEDVVENDFSNKSDDDILKNDIIISEDKNIYDEEKEKVDIEPVTDSKDNSLDLDIVNYFQNMSDEVEGSNSFKENFKEYFITIIDFIFYNKEVNGYTFDGLSGTAKAKIISIALKIDNKIEQYSPDYKENISNTGNKIYSDVKEKLITSYFDISTDVCKNNEEDCNKVKEIFGEVKDVCKIGWDFIKDLIKGGFSKVKDWYEIYSGK